MFNSLIFLIIYNLIWLLKPDEFLLVSLFITLATAKSLQLCPTLCDPIDSSPPGSSVPGILQARTLEWVAISFSRSVYIPIPKSQILNSPKIPDSRVTIHISCSDGYGHTNIQKRYFQTLSCFFLYSSLSPQDVSKKKQKHIENSKTL